MIEETFSISGQHMKLSQFKYKLPDESIALYPAECRDESRLLVLHKKTGEIEHRIFKDVIHYFDEKDLFVMNDSKVFPARLYGNKEKTNAQIEVFLLRELNQEFRLWDVLVDPARKIRIGNKLYFGEETQWWPRLSTTPHHADVHSVSSTMAHTKSSRKHCSRLV